MGITRRTISNIVVPAAVGAVAGYVAQKMGYDLSALEGLKQTVIAGLPLLAIYAIPDNKTGKEIKEETLEIAVNHPCLFSIVAVLVSSASNYLGGLGMEWLSGHDINQGFTATTGGIEGLIVATSFIATGKSRGY